MIRASNRLGHSAVETTPLGFGTAPIGNLYAAVDDEHAAAAIDAAWAAGVRFFDTAPHYGLGLAERRLGAALRGHPRHEYAVSTKVGRLLVPNPTAAALPRDAEGFDVPAAFLRRWDFSRDGIRRSLDQSLERLGLDRVDVALLHDPDNHREQAIGQAFPALHELRDEGMVGAIGAGMNQWQMLADFVRRADLDVVMLAGRYTLLEQSALDTLLPLCLSLGVSVLAAGVFNSGLLALPRPAADAPYDYRTAPPPLLERAARIAAVCERHGVTLPQAALAFPAAHPAVASVVVGARSVAEVTRNVALFGRTVPAALWADLVAEGLLRPDAPTPGRAA